MSSLLFVHLICKCDKCHVIEASNGLLDVKSQELSPCRSHHKG